MNWARIALDRPAITDEDLPYIWGRCYTARNRKNKVDTRERRFKSCIICQKAPKIRGFGGCP